MTLLLLPDCIVALAGIALVIILIDKTTGRILIHLDTLRQLLYKSGMDVISLFSGWENSKLDIERKTGLVEFEDRVLTSIDASRAIELMKEHRDEMRLK